MAGFLERHKTYHKINTLYKRDDNGRLLIGQFSKPEFEYLYNNPWICREKIDGTNIHVYWDGNIREIHGKTERANIPVPIIEHLDKVLPRELLEKVFPPKIDENGIEYYQEVRIYGEGFGKGIQKVGPRYIKDHVAFIVFDIKIGNWWLTDYDVSQLCLALDLPVVPSGLISLKDAEEIVKKGFESKVSNDNTLQAEGLVCIPSIPLYARNGERIICKIKTCDYNK